MYAGMRRVWSIDFAIGKGEVSPEPTAYRPETVRPSVRPSDDKLTPKSMNGFEPNLDPISTRQTLKEYILQPNPRG